MKGGEDMNQAKLDIMLMDLRSELEKKHAALIEVNPNAPITFKSQGKLELLEEIEEKIEELKY